MQGTNSSASIHRFVQDFVQERHKTHRGHHKINLVTFLSLVLQFPNHYSEYTRCKRWSWYDTNVLSWRTNQDLGEPIKTILGHVETDIHYWVIYGAMLLISIALCTPVLFVYE
jgi:hypothetical protein